MAPRVLHVEFCFALRDDVPDRIFEYLGSLFAALRLEGPGELVPPIESVAVVLSGGRLGGSFSLDQCDRCSSDGAGARALSNGITGPRLALQLGSTVPAPRSSRQSPTSSYLVS